MAHETIKAAQFAKAYRGTGFASSETYQEIVSKGRNDQRRIARSRDHRHGAHATSLYGLQAENLSSR